MYQKGSFGLNIKNMVVFKQGPVLRKRSWWCSTSPADRIFNQNYSDTYVHSKRGSWVPVIREHYINELYIHPLAVMFHHVLEWTEMGYQKTPYFQIIFFPYSHSCVCLCSEEQTVDTVYRVTACLLRYSLPQYWNIHRHIYSYIRVITVFQQ